MKITFLGTGAAELYPGAWCQCDYCTYARTHGGRNVRFTSSIHFADKCLVDFPADVFNKAAQYGVDLLGTELLLCTHPHEDHFDPQMLYWRYRAYGADALPELERYAAPCARFGELPLLRVFGNRGVWARMNAIFGNREVADYAMDFTIPQVYQEYHHAGVDFIPMIASHMEGGERGMIYLIHAQGKTFLYATDSDTYVERTRDCLRAHKVDAVIMEATFGEVNKGRGHMTLGRVWDEVRFFEENGLFNGEPQVWLTHMSPHRTPPYDLLCPMLEGTCVRSAYDGMTLEL